MPEELLEAGAEQPSPWSPNASIVLLCVPRHSGENPTRTSIKSINAHVTFFPWNTPLATASDHAALQSNSRRFPKLPLCTGTQGIDLGPGFGHVGLDNP